MDPIQIRLTNLNWEATEEAIQTWVSTFAKVTLCKLLVNKENKSKGLAYITLADNASLEESLKHNNELFMDRKVYIIKAKPITETKNKTQEEGAPKTRNPLIRRNQSKNNENQDKPAEQIKQNKKENKRNNKKVTDQSDTRENAKDIKPRRRRIPKLPYQPYVKMIDENSVFVSNLTWKTTELELGRHFEQYGDIESVNIFQDQQGASRGFGFVEFEQKSAVENALKANETTLEGRTIQVKLVNRERKVRSRKVSNVQNN